MDLISYVNYTAGKV